MKDELKSITIQRLKNDCDYTIDACKICIIEEGNQIDLESIIKNEVIILDVRFTKFADVVEKIANKKDIIINVGILFDNNVFRVLCIRNKTKRMIFNAYARDALFYDDTNVKLQQGDIAFFRKLLSFYNSRNVLEIACGTNRIGIEILSYVEKFDGIDLSPDMLKYATLKTMDLRASLYCKDMRDFSMPLKYDLIICAFNTLQVLDESEAIACLKCTSALLSDRGLIIIDVFNPKTEFLTTKATTECKCNFVSENYYRHLIELVETHKYDERSHRNQITYIYIDKISGKQWTNHYAMYQFNSKTMSKIIKEAELIVENKYGDYCFRPFDDSCYKQIFILRKDGNKELTKHLK
jgi:SAM-dependent methyltransferase